MVSDREGDGEWVSGGRVRRWVSGSGISEELSQCGGRPNGTPACLLPLAGAVGGLGWRVAVGGGRGVVGVACGLRVGVLDVGGLGERGAVPLGGHLVVAGVEPLRLRAVKVEPPVADEVLLVEDGAVRAEEGLRALAAQTVGDAHVEDLAVGRRVGVVTLNFKQIYVKLFQF